MYTTQLSEPKLAQKEATARIKINKLLEAAGWRFFDEPGKPANIQLERGVTLSTTIYDELGENFEKATKGYVDFLLLNDRKLPIIVLEAKSEDKHPHDGKEQARKYARSQNCRFIILSNGNLHYFWDLDLGEPKIITSFPKPDSIAKLEKKAPDTNRLMEELIADDYIVLTQRPNYSLEAAWKNESERAEFKRTNKLRFMRPYQLEAIHLLQRAVKDGKDRFLFEMATGTGKTLVAAAIIKLFFRSNNASRVLFLVDRLELETQAHKAFKDYLTPDLRSVIYKENRDDWSKADVVVTTVQSLLYNNKYQSVFSPTDFDLVISDEAHRSIGGNARAVFEYFIGYKLGLTATPRDYLKKFDNANANDPREYERRLLMDTYETFGCKGGEPTFRYTLDRGVKEGYLISPTVVDARTGITTALLSERGFTVSFTDSEGDDQEETFKQRDFERRFIAESTNQLICKTFLENALTDPVSGEIGKSIIFAVSQNHAGKLVEILNKMADRMFPGKYQSDFAVQVTSRIPDAQQFTINFANNKLLGSANFIDTYKTSKTRVCVTVGMMTTGYDCTDILNIGLFRPIFSPSEFIQIKGRGTRKHNFLELLFDDSNKDSVQNPEKTEYKLFDFFANCEYFEHKFNYDEILKLPNPGQGDGDPDDPLPPSQIDTFEHDGPDHIASIQVAVIPSMKVDRMFFGNFEERIKADEFVRSAVNAGDWEKATDYVTREVFDKPEEFYNLDKLRKALTTDRRITLREMLEKIFGLIPGFKSRDALLEEEFAKFLSTVKPDEAEAIPAIKNYFKAYVTSITVQKIIESGNFTDLYTTPEFSMRDFQAVPQKYLKLIPEYIKDYVSLNRFAA